MLRKNWGIVGYGWVARDYMVPAIRAAGGAIVAIADPHLPNVGSNEVDNTLHFSSVEALLDGSQCDLIYVATPNNAHADAVCQIAQHGIPVLCEKPLAATLADAEKMAAQIAHTGTLYGTAFDQRHHPAHHAMRAAVRGGMIGRPIAVRIVYACWLDDNWRAPGAALQTSAPNWRLDQTVAGGGAVIDLAPHGLDLAHYLLDEPATQLSAALQRRIHKYGVDDGGLLTALTDSDVLVSLHVAYNCRDVLPRRRLEVVGENGVLTALNTMGQSAGGSVVFTCGTTGHTSPVIFNETVSPFTVQAAAFCAAAAGHPHDFSMSRDIALARLLDKAYREAMTCR